jgi:hypothetical protein
MKENGHEELPFSVLVGCSKPFFGVLGLRYLPGQRNGWQRLKRAFSQVLTVCKAHFEVRGEEDHT